MRFTLSAAALLAALALPAMAATNTGLNSPASEGVNPDDDSYGWRFTVSEDLSVTELGFFAAQSGVETTLKLWDVDTVTAIATVSITAADTGWVWEALAAPELLLSGETYAVSFGGNAIGGTYASSGNFTVNSLLTFGGAYITDNPSAFPTTFVGGGTYLVDIGFETASVPLPAAAPLVLVGLAALGVAGRRRAA